MILLAIDTTGDACAAAVYDSRRDAVLGEVSETIGRGHAERLMAVIAETMKKAGTSHGDLERIGVATGPGSFTGIRVGVATARGFALGLSIPAVGVSVLEALAHEAAPGAKAKAVVLISAGRGDVHGYAGFDTPFAPARTPFLARREEITASSAFAGPSLILTGDVAAELHQTGLIGGRLAGSSPIAAIATHARLAALADPATAQARPLYLRKPDAKPQEGFAVSRTA